MWLCGRPAQGMAGQGTCTAVLRRSLTVADCCSASCGAPARRFHTDPSGTYVKYEAKAIGSGSEGAQTALQESYR